MPPTYRNGPYPPACEDDARNVDVIGGRGVDRRALVERNLRVDLDLNGYLVRQEDWTPEIAAILALGDGISLTDQHWAIISLLRAYWHEELVSPPMRMVAKLACESLGGNLAAPEACTGSFRTGLPSRDAVMPDCRDRRAACNPPL